MSPNQKRLKLRFSSKRILGSNPNAYWMYLLHQGGRFQGRDAITEIKQIDLKDGDFKEIGFEPTLHIVSVKLCHTSKAKLYLYPFEDDASYMSQKLYTRFHLL